MVIELSMNGAVGVQEVTVAANETAQPVSNDATSGK
jgi:hypothetical protein